MKNFTILLALISNAAFASDFTVEDEALAPVPKSLSTFLRANTDYNDISGRPCEFVGKLISLAGTKNRSDWVITTKPACSWAASAAPILVVQAHRNSYRVVLEQMAYDITLGKPVSNSLRNIATGRATAAKTEVSLWVFVGDSYELKWYKTM